MTEPSPSADHGTSLGIQCACGALQGELEVSSASQGNRLVCHCRDCQAFAHFLQKPEEILGAAGGTDIFQTAPGRLRLTHGAEHLACMRLSERGLVRWYSSCCKTPIGNTGATPKLAFVGLIRAGLVPRDDEQLTQLVGPPKSHVNLQPTTVEQLPSGARAPRIPLGTLWHLS